MARRKNSKKREMENYMHADKERVNNPPVGLVTPETDKETDVAALFYTLCETAKLQNVDPRAYMLEAAYAAINQPGTVLLPDALRDNSAA